MLTQIDPMPVDDEESEPSSNGAPAAVAKTNSFKPANWNLGRSGDGRIVLFNKSVQPRHRSGPRGNDCVDVGPLVGTQIGLRQNAICAILGTTKPAVRDLIARKLLRRHPATNGKDGSFYYFDPGWSFLDIYQNYVAEILEKPRRHADFVEYKSIHHLCHLGADYPVPPSVREAALEMLTEIGSTTQSEINAFIPLGDNEYEQCQEIRRELDIFWRLRKDRNPTRLDAAFIRSQLPEFAHVPATALDKDCGWERPSPPAAALARVWKLDAMRLPGILLLFVLAATCPRREYLMDVVRTLEAIDAVFRQLGPDGDFRDPQTMSLVLGYLAFGSLDSKERVYERDETVRRWLVCHRLLTRWIRYTGGSAFDRFAPGTVDAADFRAQLSDVYGHLRPEAEKRRSERAAKAADRLVVLQEVAYLRKEGIANTGSIARRAIAGMGDAPYVKFGVYDRVMAFDGTLLPGAQRNDWIAWPKSAIDEHLPELPDDPAVYVPTATDAVADPTIGASVLDEPVIDLDGYIFEYLGCEAVVGEDAFDPFFVTIFECGAPMAPAALDAEMQEHRHRLIIDANLPDYPSTPAGLLRFGAVDAALFRRTALRKRTIVPLFQMEMAMRFAHLALRAIVESFCRSGEFRQMQHSRSRWPKSPGKGLTKIAFKAFGKVTGRKGKPTEMTDYPVSEQTHDEAFDLAELVVMFCHRDAGELPDIAPPVRLDWKCEPGPYILSWNGKALGLGSLLVFLRYLLGGTGEQHDFHDFRHAASKESNGAGLPMIEIQEALKHAHPSMTQYYASLTAEQVARRTVEDLARRRSYLARRDNRRETAERAAARVMQDAA